MEIKTVGCVLLLQTTQMRELYVRYNKGVGFALGEREVRLGIKQAPSYGCRKLGAHPKALSKFVAMEAYKKGLHVEMRTSSY
jgi:hypothetical protein